MPALARAAPPSIRLSQPSTDQSWIVLCACVCDRSCDGRAPACEGVNVPCYNRAPTLPFVFSRMDQTVREHIAAQEERLKALSAQLMEEPHLKKRNALEI